MSTTIISAFSILFLIFIFSGILLGPSQKKYKRMRKAITADELEPNYSYTNHQFDFDPDGNKYMLVSSSADPENKFYVKANGNVIPEGQSIRLTSS